jgi:hypothetical protein
MIVRHIAPEKALADREALALWCQRSVNTIRQRCVPVASDVATRRALYWADEVWAMHQSLPTRKRVAKIAEPMSP